MTAVAAVAALTWLATASQRPATNKQPPRKAEQRIVQPQRSVAPSTDMLLEKPVAAAPPLAPVPKAVEVATPATNRSSLRSPLAPEEPVGVVDSYKYEVLLCDDIRRV